MEPLLASLSDTDKKDILTLIDYPNMPLFSSKYVARINGAWRSAKFYDILYADVMYTVTKNLTGPAFAVKAHADAFHAKSRPYKRYAFEKADAHFLGGSVGASASLTHAEANAKATLSGGDVSLFNWHLGAGVSTGVGIKDDSVTLKFAGCGFQFGRKLGISVFDNELAIDFGRMFY